MSLVGTEDETVEWILRCEHTLKKCNVIAVLASDLNKAGSSIPVPKYFIDFFQFVVKIHDV